MTREEAYDKIYRFLRNNLHDTDYPEYSEALELVYAPVEQDWVPTSESINALPEPLRRYIANLETLCDPAGIVRENAQLKDLNSGLQMMYRNAKDANHGN